MPKQTNQTKALITLLETPSITEASARSGLSQETIFRYLRDKGFQKEFRDARRATVDNAISALQQVSAEAVSVLRKNMYCKIPYAETARRPDSVSVAWPYHFNPLK